MRRRLLLIGIVVFLGVVVVLSFSHTGDSEHPPEVSNIIATTTTQIGDETFFSVDGKAYKLRDGDAYEYKNGSYVFWKNLYPKDFVQKTWKTENGVLYVYSSSGDRYVVRRDFADGFENIREGARGLSDLINEERQWTFATFMSPATPDLPQGAKHTKRILEGGDFLDVRVEPSSERAHTGNQSLRMSTPRSSMELEKASIETSFVHFVKGDEFWYSGWYYLEKGKPHTLMDLESSYIEGGPGFRLWLSDDLQPGFELKWGEKPMYFSNVTLPSHKWVQLKLHLKLTDTQDGIAELWMDGEKILEKQMQTLPFADVVLDRVELGLTAIKGSVATELFMDDILISHNPL
jgi:hypothetical protein